MGNGEKMDKDKQNMINEIQEVIWDIQDYQFTKSCQRLQNVIDKLKA